MTTWALEIPITRRTRTEAVREERSDLIERARTGDLVAFREIVERYSTRIHAVAYQIVGNSTDAEDIAQEVFLKLHRSLDQFNPQYPFTAWLYRLTANLSIDYQRKNARYRRVSLDEIEDESIFEDHRPRPDSHAERNELKGAIEQMAGDLTPKQRKVFVLRDLQGFSTEEVAGVLQCRPATVRVHLAKARARIKEAMMKHYPNLVS